MQVKRNILLNPGPATTSDSVKFSQVVPDICPREQEFGEMVDWIQKELVSFATSKRELAECVMIGGSGTAIVESVISSVVPENSALLVINNGAYGARIIKIAKIYKIPVVEFESSNSEAIDYNELQSCLDEAREKLGREGISLSHLAVIHHETTSGLLNNLSDIGKFASQNNLVSIVDAMSSYGAMPIDIYEDRIDFLISSSNKNIQGMAGLGIAICNRTALEACKDIPMRNLYLNLYDQYAYFLKTKQFRFTPPVQTMYALKQAIIETMAEGIEARYKRYLDSYKVLRNGMEDLGFRVLVAGDISSGFITTFFDPQDAKYDFDDMHDYLFEKGFTIYPGKVSQANTFRIANIGDIDKDDIKDFLDSLANYLQEKNISV